MANLPRSSMQLFWWLRHLQALWVKTTVVPAQPRTELDLKADVAVCYVLGSQSKSDLLALYDVCHRYKLPLPTLKASRVPAKVSGAHGAGASVYLQKMGLLHLERDSKAPPSPLTQLVRRAVADPSFDVQLVPVGVFWGRNPGREERSILKLLFFDDEHAGLLQKFFIVLAQGRVNFLNFGKPISLRELVKEGHGVEETAKKLRRVLRVHYRRQRSAVLGPSLPSRANVVAHLMRTRALKEAVEDEARKRKQPVDKVAAQARRYIIEIASEQQYAVIRLADIFLTWLWNRLFKGVVIKHAHRLREIEQTHELVYLPSHRSHMDYLLLSYSLFYEGFVPPHTAAGINLDFWPAGPILRRVGAFYIRRSFGGNRLYTVVFNEYVHYLLTKGYPLKFYTEGGRSRTGKLLTPKTGMLAMVVHSYLRNSEKPIAIVPIYIGYDKVVEVRSYLTELRGMKKRKESAMQLFQARQVLKTNFGQAYIGIGEPIYLQEFLDKAQPQWREDAHEAEVKPKWVAPVVTALAGEVLTRVNSTAVVSRLGLFALVILSAPTKALAEDDLVYLMEKVMGAMRAAPYSRDVSLPEGTAREHLQQACAVAKVERFQHPGGDVLYVDERESLVLSYYRNNIIHLIATPALLAGFFQYNDRLSEASVIEAAAQFYPLLKAEFFLRWESAGIERVLAGIVQALIQQGLLVREDGGYLRRPEVTSRELTALLILGRALGQLFERFAISTALLAKHLSAGSVVRQDFETQCTLMQRRIAILSGVTEPDFFDKNLLKNYLDRLSELGYVADGGGGRMLIAAKLDALARNFQSLLSTDIRESLRRI